MSLVEEALHSTPREVVLCGKRPERDVHLPRTDNGFIMRTGTGAHGFVEPETGKYRNMMIDDVPAIAAVANGLDEVGFVAHPFCYGVHELTSDIHGVASMVTRTDKHIWLQPYNVENVEYLIRVVAIAAGGDAQLRARPIASCIMCSFTPLEFKVMDMEALIQCGKAGIPVHALFAAFCRGDRAHYRCRQCFDGRERDTCHGDSGSCVKPGHPHNCHALDVHT